MEADSQKTVLLIHQRLRRDLLQSSVPRLLRTLHLVPTKYMQMEVMPPIEEDSIAM
jgi:hypothetical protein